MPCDGAATPATPRTTATGRCSPLAFMLATVRCDNVPSHKCMQVIGLKKNSSDDRKTVWGSGSATLMPSVGATTLLARRSMVSRRLHRSRCRKAGQPRLLLFTFSSRSGDSRYAFTPATAATLRAASKKGCTVSGCKPAEPFRARTELGEADALFCMDCLPSGHMPLLHISLHPIGCRTEPGQRPRPHLSCSAASAGQAARNSSP